MNLFFFSLLNFTRNKVKVRFFFFFIYIFCIIFVFLFIVEFLCSILLLELFSYENKFFLMERIVVSSHLPGFIYRVIICPLIYLS